MHFSELWNGKIPHRLHMIHPALFFPPPCLFSPIFLGKQLFAQTAASTIPYSQEAIKKIKPMLYFSWSIAISTYNPLSHDSPLFYAHARTQQIVLQYTRTCLWTALIKNVTNQRWWGGMEIHFFLKTNCSDMAPMDLRHYWGQSREEPCNLQELLVRRFFPYLLQWRYAATQSLTGVTLAFSGGLNRAEAMPCATSTDAFLCIRAYENTYIHSRACMPSCASLFQTHTTLTHCLCLQLFPPLTVHSRCEPECDKAGLGGGVAGWSAVLRTNFLLFQMCVHFWNWFGKCNGIKQLAMHFVIWHILIYEI